MVQIHTFTHFFTCSFHPHPEPPDTPLNAHKHIHLNIPIDKIHKFLYSIHPQLGLKIKRFVCLFGLKIVRVGRLSLFFSFFLFFLIFNFFFMQNLRIGLIMVLEGVVFQYIWLKIPFWDSYYIFWQFILTFLLKVTRLSIRKKKKEYFVVGQKRANKHLPFLGLVLFKLKIETSCRCQWSSILTISCCIFGNNKLTEIEENSICMAKMKCHQFIYLVYAVLIWSDSPNIELE